MQQDKIWDYYQNHEDADKYFSEARQRYMLSHLEGGADVLNIGVGSGALERLAVQKGIGIHALDPNRESIERLRRYLGMGDRAQVGHCQAIPFVADSFDAVVMSEVLEHLDDDVLAASLPEVWRVLRPGGFLLASTPYREDIVSNRVVCPSCGTVFHKMGHMQSFDKPRMRKMLDAHGFRVDILRVTTFVDWRRRGIRNAMKSALRVLLARMGECIADPHLVVVGRKNSTGQ